MSLAQVDRSRMRDAELAAAEYLSSVWASRQSSTRFIIADDVLHYLRSIALNHPDDRVSHFLLRKLQLAKVVHSRRVPLDVVKLGSFVEFEFAHQPQRAQLVHSSANHSASQRIDVATLLGIGLIGLTVGEVISWPDVRWHFQDLKISSVETAGARPAITKRS